MSESSLQYVVYLNHDDVIAMKMCCDLYCQHVGMALMSHQHANYGGNTRRLDSWELTLLEIKRQAVQSVMESIKQAEVLHAGERA